jgi:predicted N-acetyltransferase YhbS
MGARLRPKPFRIVLGNRTASGLGHPGSPSLQIQLWLAWTIADRSGLQLSFLHVGRDHRGLGLGVELYEAAQTVAADFGAAGLYISATPSEHTIDFYRRRGCRVTPLPDPELLALEPNDIHLECRKG